MKFSGYVGHDVRNNLEYFGDDVFNPLYAGFIWYCLDPCLLATLQNSGWIDIHEIYRIWTQGAIGSKLLYAWIDYFTFLKLGPAEVCALGVLLVIIVVTKRKWADKKLALKLWSSSETYLKPVIGRQARQSDEVKQTGEDSTSLYHSHYLYSSWNKWRWMLCLYSLKHYHLLSSSL